MPRRRRIDKRRQSFTDDQALELLLGPRLAVAMAGRSDRASLFGSEEDRRAAWLAHRDEVVELSSAAGHRPWAFWVYDVERPDLADQATEAERVAILAERGDLSTEEVAHLTERGNEARARIDSDAELVEIVPFEGRKSVDRLTAAIGDAASQGDAAP